MHLGDTRLRGTEATVPAERFPLYVEPPVLPAGWADGVRVTGAEATVKQGHGNLVVIQLGGGEPGSQVEILLPAGAGQPEARYRLTRARLPRVTVAVRSGGVWGEAGIGEVFPPASDAVRLEFSRPMDRESVESRIRNPQASGHHQVPPPLEGVRLEWTDDRTLILHFTTAPPVAAFYLSGAMSSDGLYLTREIPVVRFGEAPYLAQVDPVTGEDERIVSLPADPISVQRSSDGRTLLLASMLWETGAWGARDGLWRIDARSGDRKLLPGDWRQFRWLDGDGEVRSLQREGTGYGFYSVSPDRTRIAAVRSAPLARGDSPDFRYAHDLVILSPEGQVLQTIPNFTWLHLPPKDGVELHFTLAWSADGKRIAAQSDDREGGSIAVADLTTGEVRNARGHPKGTPLPSRIRLAYSGEFLLLGGHLLNGQGQALRELPQGSFSPDGRWLLFSENQTAYFNPSWGQVGIAEVATGKIRMLGAGLPAGWTPDGQALVMRWADWAQRYVRYPLL